MEVRSIEEIKERYKDLLENPEIMARSNRYTTRHEPLEKQGPFDEEKYQERVKENAKALPRLLEEVRQRHSKIFNQNP